MQAAKSVMVFSFLLLAIFYRTATAQQAEPTGCGTCRVWMPYGHCSGTNVNNPPPYNIAFIGTVVEVKPDNSISCHKLLRLKVLRSTLSSLPSTIDIDTGGCLYWDGRIGETVNATVVEKPMQTGVYSASGYCSGF
jgi:hypothetical protein